MYCECGNDEDCKQYARINFKVTEHYNHPMGTDNAHIFNHNLKFSNAKELVASLEDRLKLAVFNDIFDGSYNPVVSSPAGFSGLLIQTELPLTLEDYVQRKGLLEFNHIGLEDSRGHFYINQQVIENSLAEVYLGRWGNTKHMCRLIRKYGLMSFEEYKAEELTMVVDVMNGPYILEDRKNIQPHIKKFGSTAMLTFCSDHHPGFIDHIEQNWSFADFISWGKKEFIYVDFKDLVHFDFPEKSPDCYNVFIYDDFSDLKQGFLTTGKTEDSG